MIFRSGGIFGEMWNQMMRKEQRSFREAVQFIVITFSFAKMKNPLLITQQGVQIS